MENLIGLIAATFTPMDENGRLDLNKVPRAVEQLIAEKVQGLYVCGGTGEGASLTIDERKATAEAFIVAANGRIPVIIQVGHNSLFEAKGLAKHAAEAGADAISAIPPTYFKPESPESALACLSTITAGAPDLPFIYYHIPTKTGLTFDMVSFLEMAEERLPSLTAVKFTDARIDLLMACMGVGNGRYDFYFGWDEMMLTGLNAGAKGAIGTTYNFAAPLYQRVFEAQQSSDFKTATKYQNLAVKMVRTIHRHGGIPAHKSMMEIIGLYGPTCRMPNQTLSKSTINQLKVDLEEIGFFEWGRNR